MNDDDEIDATLRTALRGTATESTSRSLELPTRRRIRQQVQRRVLVRSAVAMTVVAAIVGWQVRSSSSIHSNAVAGLELAELEALFAPPPVISLHVLDRQQDLALRALRRLESTP